MSVEKNIDELLLELNQTLSNIDNSKEDIINTLRELGSTSIIYGTNIKLKDVPQCIKEVTLEGAERHYMRCIVPTEGGEAGVVDGLVYFVHSIELNEEFDRYIIIFTPRFYTQDIVGGILDKVQDYYDPYFPDESIIQPSTFFNHYMLDYTPCGIIGEMKYTNGQIQVMYDSNNYYIYPEYDAVSQQYYVDGMLYILKTKKGVQS